jgi:membrane associated rhomboid family serine protease
LKTEEKRFLYSIIFPFIFLLIIWIVELFEQALGTSYSFLGVYPRTIEGLAGIVTMPFIHGGVDHILSNTFPVFILSTGIIYLYRDLGYKAILYIWLTTGIITWAIARPSYHIGASGLIYGFAAFLFFSGLLRRDNRMLAISMIVAFLYGSLVWGLLPVKPGVSFEGHLAGALSGLIFAYVYRNKGPQPLKYEWELEEEYDEQSTRSIPIDFRFQTQSTNDEIKITYIYRDGDDEDPIS